MTYLLQSKRKFELLNRAVQKHARLTREAATGRGIDRHLLGLRLLMKQEDGETADLFSDELFQRSQTWKLSTSGLSAGYQFRGTGFGAAYSDGYGINCEWSFTFLANVRHETGGQVTLTGSVCVCCSIVVFHFRFGGPGFDKVWDRVEEIVQGNFHGSFHRRYRFGLARHAGYLRGGVEPDGAPVTMSAGEGGSVSIICCRRGKGFVAYTCRLHHSRMT